MEEASFAISAFSCALSSMLSSRTSQQLRQMGVPEGRLHDMKEMFKSIQIFVEDVCNRFELRDELTRWLQKVNELTFRIENAIDEHECGLLSRKNPAFSLLSLEFGMCGKVKNIFNLLTEIKTKLSELELDKKAHIPISLPSFNPERDDHRHHLRVYEFVGSLEEEMKIVRKLHVESGFTVAIVGMPGIGKTTLAARIYQNEAVGDSFAKKFWVTVGGIIDEKKIMEKMLWSLEERENDACESQEIMMNRLRQAMEEERVLLVLDDVQSVNQGKFNELMHNLQRDGVRIKVLVTTRRIEIATTMGAFYTHNLQKLSGDESWDLFKMVFTRTSPIVREKETIGKQIVQKCHGVPLAIRRLASLLQSKENVADWEILSATLFTYYRLPKAIKRCFAYCSLFPKEAVIRKYDLIGLWLAQGFLPEETVDCSIETGKQYFDVLLNESLIKVRNQDEDGNVVDCTMHVLVHDLAMHFSRHDTYIIDDQRNRPAVSHQSDVQHLVFSSRRMNEARDIVSHSTRLRTIYAMRGEISPYPVVAVLETMLSHAIYLHVLKLDGIGLKEVPTNLGKLKYLRYLDLSNNPLKHVPRSIAHLYLLQTLWLRSCEELENVENPPKGISYLTYLSLIEASPKQYPPNKLPSTVHNMQPPVNSDEKEKKFTRISEVRDLKDFPGILGIKDLEGVEDKKASQEAEIGKRYRLSGLELHWSREALVEGNSRHNHDEDILDGLQPHPNIQMLKLVNYASQQFPMWVMNMKVEDNDRRLYKLVKIELVDCKNCLKIPTLGQLLSLQELLIAGMHNIREIGQEIYKYADDSQNKDSLEEFFPALRRLELRDLSSLTAWQPALTRGKEFQTFSRLETLKVVNCRNLTCIPINSKCMVNLLIQGIQKSDWLHDIIANSCEKHTLTSLVLSRVPDLRALPDQLSRCTSLKELSLQECEHFKDWPPNPWNLISLKELCIDNCSSLEDFPSRGLTSLNTLVIRGCGNLGSVPQRIETYRCLMNLAITNCKRVRNILHVQQLTNLIELDILDCERMESMPVGLAGLTNLRTLRIGGGNIKFHELPQCRSLETLWVKGTKDSSAYLPHQILCLTQLKVLRVWNFTHMEKAQSWICKLTNLQVLIFEDCSILERLPAQIEMLKLRRLHCLRIDNCAALEQKYDNDHWKTTYHVPHIKFKGCWLQGNRRLLLQENPVQNPTIISTEVNKFTSYYYFIRNMLHDCIRGRSSFRFYFMASCVLHIVIIILELCWTIYKQ